MNIATLSWRYLWARPVATVLNMVLLTLALASITFVVLVRAQVEHSFERDLRGIDAVVGAKGSPLQLILSGVFHLDVPPGNVPLAEVEALARQPQVAQVIPSSLGDSFRGARIVGTTPDFLALYALETASGAAWSQPLQAVAGAQVAATHGLAPGSRFMGTHGLGGGGESHGDTPYTVSGVLAPCACVADRLILTSLESVWQVHEKDMALDEEDRQALQAEREVTMALVRYRTPLAAVTFPRWVNGSTGLQAAAPAVEITRLLRMLGVGTEVLRGAGAVLLLTAGISVFIALWNAVRERRADLAMLRMLGAPPRRLAALLVAEALWLAVLSTVLGLAAGHALVHLVGSVLEARQSLPITGATWVAEETWIATAAVAVALAAGLLPARAAYKADVAQLLDTR